MLQQQRSSCSIKAASARRLCNSTHTHTLKLKPPFASSTTSNQSVQTLLPPMLHNTSGRTRSSSFQTYSSSSSSASEALLTSNSDSDSLIIGNEKVGVLLLNLGGPETLDDVQPFLFNLFADPDIIRLPRMFRFFQKPLAQFISVVRAPKSKEGYASIGGGSPLRQITDAQAEELRKALWEKNVPAKVYVGMRYWHPFTEEAIEQ